MRVCVVVSVGLHACMCSCEFAARMSFSHALPFDSRSNSSYLTPLLMWSRR